MRPLTVVYLEAVARLNRAASRAIDERDEARRAVRDALAERNHLCELVCSLREESAGWQRRAEALADALDPALVEAIFGVIDTVERLPEVGA